MSIEITDFGDDTFEVNLPPPNTEQRLNTLRDLKNRGFFQGEIDSQIALFEKRLALEMQIKVLQKELEEIYR